MFVTMIDLRMACTNNRANKGDGAVISCEKKQSSVLKSTIGHLRYDSMLQVTSLLDVAQANTEQRRERRTRTMTKS